MIELEGLTKDFGSLRAVDGIHLIQPVLVVYLLEEGFLLQAVLVVVLNVFVVLCRHVLLGYLFFFRWAFAQEMSSFAMTQLLVRSCFAQ
mgnify:CR=1 FL=1